MKIDTLHIANTNFEFELSNQKGESLQDSLEKHPLSLQLQFLPLLYASSFDAVAVTTLPPDNFVSKFTECRFIPLSSNEKLECQKVSSWGYSQKISAWAAAHGVDYPMPKWDVVRQVNSKIFSFEHSPKLLDAMLLHNEQELNLWIEKKCAKSVLKSAFGFSGRGNLIVDIPSEHVLTFCKREWEHGRAVIAEPWMNRVLDFSTQWHIEKGGEVVFVGATMVDNDAKGSYRSTSSGPEEHLFSGNLVFLEQHKIAAGNILKVIKEAGYFGPLGIDAMLYLDEEGKTMLQPVVEVNARQTMSLAILLFQRKHFPNETITVSYMKKQQDLPGLLPEGFTRQLYIISTSH